MIHRLLLSILIAYSGLFFIKNVLSTKTYAGYFSVGNINTSVLGTQKYVSEGFNFVDGDNEFGFPQIVFRPQIETTTAFDQKNVEEYEELAYGTEYVDDHDLEYGLEIVERAGVLGKKTYQYLVTYWADAVIDKRLMATEITSPINEVIAVGKKIVWHELDTPDLGEIKYWRKMTVLATKYDSTCLGCNNTTALGAPVQEGVCAVDPTVIDMYTHFYVPGYGKCQALDVGGMVKGNHIDLAFRNASTAAWGTQKVEIYLMDNIPEEDSKE